MNRKRMTNVNTVQNINFLEKIKFYSKQEMNPRLEKIILFFLVLQRSQYILATNPL